MKEMWERPRILVEEFAPNDYVAACWGVGCDHSSANDWEQTHVFGTNNEITKSWQTSWYDKEVSHSGDHCGNSGNQVIYDDDNDGTADRMVEVGTDGLGTLGCTIWTDENYNEKRDIWTVSIGDTIYWTTQSGDKVWHHIGKVFATVFGHPNRS